jgi:hypothetical protein
MRINPAGKHSLGPGQVEGIGHPNVILQNDFRGTAGWCVVVETAVPVKNFDDIRALLESGKPADLRPLAESIVAQVPADGGDQFGARHMVAAAFGFELADDGKSIAKPRSFKAPEFTSTEREVRRPLS